MLVVGDVSSSTGDYRMAIVHLLLTGYASTAYVILLQAARRSVEELRPVLDLTTDIQIIMDRAGTYGRWGLMAAGVSGVLIGLYATVVTTVGPEPWDWELTNFDARWMRVLGPIFGWWIGCMMYVLAVESSRLSQLSDSIRSLDLLDLQPYEPLIRLGLTNVLLLVGLASVLTLFLFEPGFAVLMIQVFCILAVFSWIGLMLPLRGIRRKIKESKQEELDWCRQSLKSARDELKTGADVQQSITEIIAYKAILEDIRNWPFDSPSLTRFALYLLIPVGSMFGGAFVERGLDFFLP